MTVFFQEAQQVMTEAWASISPTFGTVNEKTAPDESVLRSRQAFVTADDDSKKKSVGIIHERP